MDEATVQLKQNNSETIDFLNEKFPGNFDCVNMANQWVSNAPFFFI